MFITKCDICKKVIKDDQEKLSVRYHFSSLAFHPDCARPVYQSLKKHGFIKKTNNGKTKKKK